MRPLFNLLSPWLFRLPPAFAQIVPNDTASFNIDNIPGYIDTISLWLLNFAIGVAVIFIIVGGLQYIGSGGNSQKADQAKTTLTFAIGGLILIILARAIILFTCTVFSSDAFCRTHAPLSLLSFPKLITNNTQNFSPISRLTTETIGKIID